MPWWTAPLITVALFTFIHEVSTHDVTEEVRLDMNTTPLHIVAIIGSLAGAVIILLT